MAAQMFMDDEQGEERFEPGSCLMLNGDVVKRLFPTMPELDSEFVADAAFRVTMISSEPPAICLQLIAIAPETDEDTDLTTAEKIYGKEG